MLREQKNSYEGVFAETTVMEADGDRAMRQYLIAADVVEAIEKWMTGAGVDHDLIDNDEVYSRFEATSPDWFQIPH